MQSEARSLTKSSIKSGLQELTICPTTLSYVYTKLQLIKNSISNIEIVRCYPYLQEIDLSQNEIEDLSPLEDLPFLICLKISNNKINKLLQFFPGREVNEESPGIGSILEYADLSFNDIHLMESINHHVYLSTLILSNNQISYISGINRLYNLKYLDLSNNKITKIYGIDELPLLSLDLSHNGIEKIENLRSLKKIRKINLSYNKISEVEEIGLLDSIQELYLQNNLIDGLFKLDCLKELRLLTILDISENPIINRPYSYLRIIYRLKSVLTLNNSPVSALSRVDSCVLHGDDVQIRQENLQKYLPSFVFENLREPFVDSIDDTEPLYESKQRVSKNDIISGISDISIEKSENIENWNDSEAVEQTE